MRNDIDNLAKRARKNPENNDAVAQVHTSELLLGE